jgi:isoleucyl-tRNA synthetase
MTRVPDLIDVWFDSGAMPVAQHHYPFENKAAFERQFPADYICEAVDQTRGWFYSLHAISALLFDSVAYKNVICLGLILDSNGEKMSKSKGNVVDPSDVLNAHGADAFRWYLYTASPPGQERRFSADLVGSVVRDFTLPLWNVYSFFATYANLDQWTPSSHRLPPHSGPGKRGGLSSLDRWLLSELNVLIRDVTAAYERYDVPGATRPVQDFVERLSNWYLRRSRRRFWKSGSDADKQAAYFTLYTALTSICKLIAPAMPFLAEELYQNLVRTVDVSEPESVHLATWPEDDPGLVDEGLNRDMALVMRLVSLGHAARSKADRKVRQPLAEAAFSVGNLAERNPVGEYAPLISDELNVKRVRLLDASAEAVSHTLKPLPKQLGQKYGNRFPAIQRAILALDPETAAHALMAGSTLAVVAEGESYQILPSEVEVRAQAKEGFAVAEDGPYVAALVTELTAELIQEGMAREFVRRVQDLRKKAGYEVADRITVYVQASRGLEVAIRTHRDYILAETLGRQLHFRKPPEEAARLDADLDGERLELGLIRVEPGR